MASTTPQHKRRLSNLFGTKKVKDKDLPPIVTHHQVDPPTSTANHQVQPSTSTASTQPDSVANHQLHPSTSTATTTGQPDSAYASSSNNPSSKRASLSNAIPESRNNADMVPVENNGNIEGVSSERNLAYNTSTGQVVDDDTGQVVVTTTTTTTTTMSTRTGKKTTHVDVQTQPTIAEAPGDMPPMRNTTSHSPAPPALPEPSTSSSPVVTPMSQPAGTPVSQPVGTPQSHRPVPHRVDTDCPVPARNPMREREPMDPVSPLRPNFSYPSRSDIREDPMPQQPMLYQPTPQHPMPQQQPAPRGTFANLKAAAQGLHVSLLQGPPRFPVSTY